MLGGSAEFWLSREAKYREAMAHAEENEPLENEAGCNTMYT